MAACCTHKGENHTQHANMARSPRSKESLPSGFGAFHNSYKFQTSADNYCDNMMKNKLNPLHTFDSKTSPSQSLSPPSALDLSSHRLSPESRLPPLSTPTSLPLRGSILEEPERYTATPMSSTLSPRLPPFSSNSRSPRSPSGNSDVDYPLRRQLSVRTNSLSLPDESATSPRGPFDVDGREDAEIPETSSMRKLRIDDASRDVYVAGLKRRASSPPAEEPMLYTMASQGDLRRRELPRGSPTPRLGLLPKGSVSSVSPTGRGGSSTPTLSISGAAGTASGVSFGRRSPTRISPGGASVTGSEYNSGSPYSAISPSPHATTTRLPLPQTAKESRSMPTPRKVGETTKTNLARMQGFMLMCECCPKKPKKFDTLDELTYVHGPTSYTLPPSGTETLVLQLTKPKPQRARGREAIRVFLLRQPLQKQERGRAPPEQPPRAAAQLELQGADQLPPGVPREHQPARRGAGRRGPGGVRPGLGRADPAPDDGPQVPGVQQQQEVLPGGPL
jgi:hypothetical protein